jgi:hypothetical protein
MTTSRTESFVPLSPASPRPAGERREFRATVISQSGQTQTFQSVAATPTPSIANATAPGAAGEPKVSLQRDGSRVTGIHLQCSCGQVIDLSCVYDGTPAQPAAAPQPATIPQPEPAEPAPGKICKDSGKDLPISKAKKPKVPEKGRGTSAAKRRPA